MRIPRIRLRAGEECRCSRSHSSGRSYFGYRACSRCGCFIVNSAEARRLEQLAAAQAERERILAAKQAAEAA
jgi:hypothetical protein